MVILKRVALLCALLLCAIASRVQQADAHPLHTTLADIQLDRGTGSVRVMVRVFADDVDGGIARVEGAAAVTDARRVAYVSGRLGIADQHGRSVSLQACGLTRRANLLWICLTGRVRSATLMVSNALLVDVYADQVNLVQATDGHVKRTVLFTRGDHAKSIF